jgi:hypothetical protein
MEKGLLFPSIEVLSRILSSLGLVISLQERIIHE